jgi:hypothetical protein
MIKNAIAPIQAWLMSQGRCVGCSQPLSQGKHEKYKGESEKVTCKCKRVYIFDTKTSKYRRALLEEA